MLTVLRRRSQVVSIKVGSVYQGAPFHNAAKTWIEISNKAKTTGKGEEVDKKDRIENSTQKPWRKKIKPNWHQTL